MPERDPALATFLETLEAAVSDKAPAGSPPAAAAERAFSRLRAPGDRADPAPIRAPACDWLDDAQDRALSGPAAALARAFAGIAPKLAWRARQDRQSPDPEFPRAHANAVIVGDGGLEVRDDVRMGVSLLAPNTVYPDHHHPPEEVYVALSAGEWRQEDGPWTEPGPGGLIYNPPDILHAMRSGAAPLLAIWTLPMDAR